MASKKIRPKLGAPLTPESPGDPVVVIPPMEPAPAGGGEDEWSFSMASIGLVLDLSAEHVVDGMRRQAIVDTREALLTGQRPDGKGPQRKLRERTAEKPGRQSPYRGYNTGVLADGIKATKITGNTSQAKCRIVPPPSRNVYVAQELKAGVAILTAEGKIGEGMRAAAQRVVEAMCTGREVKTNPDEVEAEDA